MDLVGSSDDYGYLPAGLSRQRSCPELGTLYLGTKGLSARGIVSGVRVCVGGLHGNVLGTVLEIDRTNDSRAQVRLDSYEASPTDVWVDGWNLCIEVYEGSASSSDGDWGSSPEVDDYSDGSW